MNRSVARPLRAPVRPQPFPGPPVAVPPAPARPARRPSGRERAGAALAAVVTAASGVACGGDAGAAARAADFVPADVLAFLTASLDPPGRQREHLRALCGRFERVDPSLCSDVVGGAMDALFEDMGLDYRRDVHPWAGDEIAVALLRPAEGDDDGEPRAALFVEARDTNEAGEALEPRSTGGAFDYGVVGSFVVFADEGRPAENEALLDTVRAVTQAEDPKVLADDPRWTELAAELPDERLVLGWMDAFGIAQTFADAGGGDFPFPVDDLFGAARRQGATGAYGVALYAEDDALALEGVAGGEIRQSEGTSGRPVLTEGLPPDTVGAVTVFGIGPLAREALDELEAEPGVAEDVFGGLGAFGRATGFDVRADLLSWMGGEAVVALGPVTAPDAAPPLAVVVEPTDPARAQAGVAKLVALVQQVAGLPLTPVPVPGVDGAVAHIVPQPMAPGVQPAMVLLPDRFVLASTPEYLTRLARPSVPGFGASEEYRRAAGDGGAVSSQVFLRVDALREAIVAMLSPEDRREYETDLAPWVEPLRSLLARAEPAADGRFLVKLTAP